MKRTSWFSTGTMAALAMAAVSAMAQDPPATAEPATEPEEEEAVAKARWNSLTLGWTTTDKDRRGSDRLLSRYARPTERLSIHHLKLLSPLTEKSPFAWLDFHGAPGQDTLLEGYVALNQGHTVVRGSSRKTSFYDFNWLNPGRSQGDRTEFTVDHSLYPNLGGFLTVRKEERHSKYPTPRERDHTNTQVVGGGVAGNVLGGNLGVSAMERITKSSGSNQPKTLQRTIDAGFTRDFGPAFTLGGTAAYTKIEQNGLSDSGVRAYTVGGAWDLTSRTGLAFQLGRQDLDLDTVRNAYVRQRFLSSVRLVHRWPGWNFQFGFKHKESERVRSDQSYVDVPKSNVYDASLAGRLGPARLTLKGKWEDLKDSATMGTLDKRQLLWDDRATFQAKLDGGSESFTAYGVFTYRWQQNKQRDVEIGWNNLTFGGSYILNPAISVYAEYAVDDFRADGEDAGTGKPLDFYFPRSRTATFGLNWSKDPSLSASAGLNTYETGDVRGTQLTLSLRRSLGRDRDLEFIVAPWRHDDKLSDLTNYRTTFLMARYSVKF